MITDDRTIHAEQPESATNASSTFRSPRRGRRNVVIGLLVGLALIMAIAAGAYGAIALRDDTPPLIIEQAVPSTPTIIATGTGGVDASAIGEAVIPSVVTVEIGQQQEGSFAKVGSGSGVVFDSAGLIVTNDHVVENAEALRVVLADGRVYDAEIVGTDPLTDLAVLQIGASGLTAIEFGSTIGIQVGEPAVAVGNPLGLEGGPSLTVGVISALGREVQTDADSILYGMLQTDAPITSGSSGGTLVDSIGRLIGITTAVGVSRVGVEGIGFATPVEIVERVIADIVDDGRVDHALIGITGSTAYADTGDGGQEPIGVEVQEVTAGSGAANAGLNSGDVITALGGVHVRTMDELITALRTYGAGDVAIVDLSDGSTASITLTPR